MTDLVQILSERKKTHGEYRDHARYTQKLKEIIHDGFVDRRERVQIPLSYHQIESLDMVAHKIGRILAGDCNEPDHWDDIAGYAKLVSDRIREDRLSRPFKPQTINSIFKEQQLPASPNHGDDVISDDELADALSTKITSARPL